MNKILAGLIIAFFFTPVLAAADSNFGVEPTLGQLLSRLAAVKAMESGKTIGCEVAATKTTVRAGEAFTIGWGSYGADPSYSSDPKNAYTQNGQQAMQIDTAETRTYKLTFFGPNGASVTCEQTIAVIAR